MVTCCCVPGCHAREPGHRFPANSERRKKWLIAIRRENFTPTAESRVCKSHFVPEDYELPKDSVSANPRLQLKKTSVPSLFFWTKAPSASAIARKRRACERKSRPTKKSATEDMAYFEDHMDLVEVEVNEPTEEAPQATSESEAQDIVDTIAECGSDVLRAECLGAQVTPTAELFNAEELSSGEGMSSKEQASVIEGSSIAGAFRIINYVNKPHVIHYYTGLINYEHFNMIMNILGDSVNDLQYYPDKMSKSQKLLEPEDELFLTLMKLRHNFDYFDLAERFQISKSLASNIFITWVNLLYCVFKDINIWPSQSSNVNYEKFKGNNVPSTIIIDCSEFNIEKPSNPVAQQLTWSSYKNRNTVKVLIGINRSGAVIFISDAHGGSISDRELFERSGLIDLLRGGDVILCDRGFNIQDLVAHKNVKISVPAFLKKGVNQFEPNQLKHSKKVSHDRIHVERVIGLGKTYEILNNQICTEHIHLAGRIIFVCYMLANMRPNIVHPLLSF